MALLLLAAPLSLWLAVPAVAALACPACTAEKHAFLWAVLPNRIGGQRRPLPRGLDHGKPGDGILDTIEESSGSARFIVGLIGIGISIWGLVEVGFLRGTAGQNRYGPDPLADPGPLQGRRQGRVRL